jgi:multidrug efflux system membrane fusion protein
MSTQLTDPPALSPSPAGQPEPEPGGSNGSILRKVLIVLVIVAAVGGAVWKIRKNQATQTTTAGRMNAMGDRPQPVLIASVQQKTMPIYIEALGTVTPYYSVTVKSRVDGQLMSVNVREGQAVHKGQLLAVIDPGPYQAAVAEAQGQLVKDQANAENARAEAQRYTALLNAGVVSKESQQLQVSTAGQAEGAIDADKAAIQAAEVNLAYTRITSPIDGVVGLRQVDPGNIVHAADTTGLLLVTQLQPIAVIFTLPEDQLPTVLQRIRSGATLPVQAWDRSESTHLANGTVLTADNQIDSTTGTDKIKAVFANKDNALFPNQFVNVRLVLEQRPNSLVVPASAIQTGSNGNFVFVLKKGVPPSGASNPPAGSDAPAASPQTGRGAHSAGEPYYVVAQPVKVDVTEGAQAILSSGLNPNDQVVIDGQEKLLDGSRVLPRTEAQLPGGGTHASWGQGDEVPAPFTATGNASAGAAVHSSAGRLSGSAHTPAARNQQHASRTQAR